MKKGIKLIPLFLIFICSLFVISWITYLEILFLILAFIFLLIYCIYFVFSIVIAPYDGPLDIIADLISLILLFIYIPGVIIYFLKMLPYGSFVLLFPLIAFIWTLVIFIIKFSHYKTIVNIQKNK